jgi:uracil-DNA glycosylase family 4
MQEFNKRATACGLEVDCLGFGRLDSEIVIIGEAPGEREKMMKMPLVGPSGKFFWDHMAWEKIDVRRPDCYVTNVIKKSLVIPTKMDARRVVKGPELEHWEGLLDWELDHLPNVKYIVALGNYALHALTGDTGITNWRGSVLDVKIGHERRVVKVVFTNNPAHVMRSPNLEVMYRYDLAKLRRVMDGKFKTHKIKAIINPTVDQAIQYVDELQREGKPVAFDIETIGYETACIGFANNAHSGMCINFRDKTENRFTLEEEKRLRLRIQEFFLSDIKLIAQNAAFDCGWLGFKDRIHVPQVWFDTLLAHHTLYPRFPHSLGYLTAQYTDHPYYKDEGKRWRESGNIDEHWEYNVKDCCITWAAHVPLLAELVAQDMEDFFFSHVMRLQPHLVAMTIGGIKADTSLKEQIARDLKEELDEQLRSFHVIVHRETGDREYDPNPGSSKQLKELFYERLNMVGRGGSTARAARDRILDDVRTTEGGKELIRSVNVWKEGFKFLTTYANSKIDADGRFRCEYKQFGTSSAPGRLSSAKTLWGTGMNLQNQPRKAYPMFIADDGYMFSYFDLSQAEAKVVAYAWQVEGLIETFERQAKEEGFDVHRGNAARIFHVPYEQVPKEDKDHLDRPTLRFLGKRCVHGLNYRMGPRKLAEVCGIPNEQAQEAYASYHRAYPEIQVAWSRTIQTIRDDKMLFSLLGRRMIYLERFTEESFDSCIAFVPQSTIGDKVASVIYLCHDDPEWPSDARMVLNIHDALIAIHRPDDAECIQRLMKKHAEEPIMIRAEPITIFTDIKASVPDSMGIHRWSTLREVQQASTH